MADTAIVILEEIDCFDCGEIGEVHEQDTGYDIEMTTCECCEESVHYGCRQDHESRCWGDQDDARYEHSLFYRG